MEATKLKKILQLIPHFRLLKMIQTLIKAILQKNPIFYIRLQFLLHRISFLSLLLDSLLKKENINSIILQILELFPK